MIIYLIHKISKSLVVYVLHPHSNLTELNFNLEPENLLLGYKSGYKGYIFLDLRTRAIFIYRNVVFHENLLPYQTSTPYVTTDWHYITPSPSPFIDVPDHKPSSIPPPTSTSTP